jgi:hypothetical protein
MKRPAYPPTFAENAALALGTAGALIVALAQAAGVLP